MLFSDRVRPQLMVAWVVVLLLILAVVPIAATNAAPDTTAPVVLEMSISPQTVDVTTASQPVTVTAHITDDISGT
ncbi:hypothetical protein, partial [Arthrobacter sp. UYEF36]|uniref:hypothetical protein n=1 Tax=Arthrobacter sp. UYEF36 TaxID=1756366 RepID=UPI00339A6527